MRDDRKGGVILDPLFVGVTRPAMTMGVTYSAAIVNFMLTSIVFLLTKNLLWLLICFPIHGVCWLLCKNEPRYFDLLSLAGWMYLRRFPSNRRYWNATTYSPLRFDLPDTEGRRRWVWGLSKGS